MRDYFCGWYFKCQSDTQTFAVIPAIHKSKNEKSCSIQLITDDGAFNIPLPYDAFELQTDRFHIQAAGNSFGETGIELCLHTPDCSATGSVQFGAFSPIRYDIMGPFQYLPFMECRHSVLSMKHTINGDILLNGIDYHFENGVGYLEGDRGYSFPNTYVWTQCHFEDGSLMLSAADIPLGLFHFTGVIAVIQWKGKEYRLATYLGAKAVKIQNGEITIRQNDLVLTAKLIEKHSHPLFAPVSGKMNRTIHESAACRASYTFAQGGRTLFSFESSNASFEYEYPN